MTEHVQQLLTAAYELRWVLVVAGFIILGALYALALGQLHDEREWSAQLEEEAAADRRKYGTRVPVASPLEATRGQIVALPPRREGVR